MKERIYSASALPSLSPPLVLSLSSSPSLSSCGARLSLLLRAIYAKGKRAEVRLCNRAPSFSEGQRHECVCLLKEHDWGWIQVRLEIRKWEDPTVNAAAAVALRQAVSRWMNGSLSGAWERMGRGSCMPTTGIRQREHGRQVLQLNIQRQRVYTLWFFFSPLVWFSASLSLQRKLAVRFVGSVCSVGRSPLRTDTQTIPDPVCYLSRIFPAGEYTWKNHIVSRARKKVDQGFFPSLSLSSPQRCCRSSPWQDTWFPLSKRRSSFVNGFGFFFSWKGFFSLCMAVPNSNGVDFTASRVDYIIWKAECETRPYLSDRESNILTYLPPC